MLIEQHLALEIMGLDEIAIDQAKMADAGPNQGIGQDGTQGPATTKCNMAIEQPALAFFAHAREAHLPAVAFESGVHYSPSSLSPKPESRSATARIDCFGHF